MKTILKIVVFTLISVISHGQDYCPLKKGEVQYFEMKRGSYVRTVLKEDVEINGEKYTPIETVYSWGAKTTSHIRIDKEGNRIYLDSDSKLESIEFPANIKRGYKWKSTDEAWSYEIILLDAEFKIKKTEFNNCLVIKAEQLTGRDKTKSKVYYNFYAENIGYVGGTNEKEYGSWLVGNL